MYLMLYVTPITYLFFNYGTLPEKHCWYCIGSAAIMKLVLLVIEIIGLRTQGIRDYFHDVFNTVDVISQIAFYSYAIITYQYGI